MNEQNYAVVFDTNSYRQLVTGKSTPDCISYIKNIILAEDKQKIKAYGSVIVGLEMLGNLTEGDDGINFKDCLNGVITMGYHCEDIIKHTQRIIPHAYLLITNSFFSSVPQDLEKLVLNIGGVINDFKDDFNKAYTYHKNKTFSDVKNYIDNEENSFSNIIIDLIEGLTKDILSQHPTIHKKDLRNKLLNYIMNGTFESIIALVIILMTASRLQIKLPESESQNMALSLIKEFPLSVGFYKWICNKIVADTIDMRSKTSQEKRWNWSWDYHISFIISKSKLDNREVILVTSDGDLRKILIHFGFSHKIMTISEYLTFLGF
jgi:hypothetical protein